MKKTALITGGSRGIGFAIAFQLGLDGYNIVIFDLNSRDFYIENLNKLEAANISYIYIEGNICKESDRQKAIANAIAEYGGIHVLVNNAGVVPRNRSDLLEMTEESFDIVVGINTKGTMFITQAVAKQMINQDIINGKRGCIINISSCSAEASSTNRGEYCVSKAGVSMLTKLYADRLAREAIYVNEVRPGIIATEMTSTVQEKYNKKIKDGVFPIARWGTPEDVAGAVSALCSDKFNYSTGIHIDVDGGFHIRRL